LLFNRDAKDSFLFNRNGSGTMAAGFCDNNHAVMFIT